ncbi:MAG: hypothetical protein ABIQ31_27170 [Ferruginibacter sp.]
MKSIDKSTDSAYLLLKNEIEETFGKKINSARDCLLLSEEVFSKNSFTVNSNTLRRFFGLVKSPNSPSHTTVDILSKYCGFASFDEFKKLKNNFKKSTQDYYSQSILNYLVSLFKETTVKNYRDKTFVGVTENTINFLQRHPELIDKFQRAVSKTKNGQDFYYEQFVNVDGLNSYYGNSLRYYLVEKKNAEAQIFGHSVLCLKDWLSENTVGVKKHYDEVIKYSLTKISRPDLYGRFFATQLFFTEIFGLPKEKILTRILQSHNAIRQKNDDFRLFPHFEYVIAPALLLSGHPEEALYYIDYAFNNYPDKDTRMEQGFYQTMYLIKALVCCMTDRNKEAEKLYLQLFPARFYFLSKKINTILYIFLSQHLYKKDPGSDLQMNDLIKETGFIRLHKILKIYIS